MNSIFVFLIFSSFSNVFAQVQSPQAGMTPGVLCSASDLNFQGFDYPEKIARCVRNVGIDIKIQVAQRYGNIPRSSWHLYEFDHLIPLCAGGSDDINNLWPQPMDQARKKDALEINICTAMKQGKINQVQAVQKIHEWISQNR